MDVTKYPPVSLSWGGGGGYISIFHLSYNPFIKKSYFIPIYRQHQKKQALLCDIMYMSKYTTEIKNSQEENNKRIRPSNPVGEFAFQEIMCEILVL
nr:hypothetical protein [uncultured Treponema sp.]